MNTALEKRQQTRHYGIYPVQLSAAKPAGKLSKIHTVADNLSQGGVYLQMPYVLEVGSKLFLIIGLSTGAKLAAFGQVLRTESQDQHLMGVAIQFHRSRLLASTVI